MGGPLRPGSAAAGSSPDGGFVSGALLDASVSVSATFPCFAFALLQNILYHKTFNCGRGKKKNFEKQEQVRQSRMHHNISTYRPFPVVLFARLVVRLVSHFHAFYCGRALT